MQDPKLLLAGLGAVSATAFGWWSEVIKEAKIGHHVEIVRNMLRLGVKLFIVSEIMLFFSFFWAWFHSALNPTVWIGNVWPPKGIDAPDPLGLPLAMTLTLAASGIAANWAQLAMRTHLPHLPGGYDRAAVTKGLSTAIALGIFFLGMQWYEYSNTPFTISDSAYGSTFYMATGLHGMHVLIGVGALIVSLLRHQRGHFKPWQHVGFESSIWYWQASAAAFVLSCFGEQVGVKTGRSSRPGAQSLTSLLFVPCCSLSMWFGSCCTHSCTCGVLESRASRCLPSPPPLATTRHWSSIERPDLLLSRVHSTLLSDPPLPLS